VDGLSGALTFVRGWLIGRREIKIREHFRQSEPFTVDVEHRRLSIILSSGTAGFLSGRGIQK
jgi:hypothetical protein